MRHHTHAAGGLLTALLALKLGVAGMLSMSIGHGYLIFALFGALLPDIDNHRSKIGRQFPVMSRFAELLLGHRGPYHSIFGLAATEIIFYCVLRALGVGAWRIILFSLALGFMSHLALDSLTEKGINWLRPLHGFHVRGPFKTGGLVDSALVFVFAVAALKIIGDYGLSALRFL